MKDILDLCRLNLMGEHIEESLTASKPNNVSDNERAATLKAIAWKRQQIVDHMTPSPRPARNEAATK